MFNFSKIFSRFKSRLPQKIAGVSLIEFSVTAGIFLPLLLAVFDIALMSFIKAELQYVADAMSRSGGTGSYQLSALSSTTAASNLKTYGQGLMPLSWLSSGTTITVGSASNFQTLNGGSPSSYPTPTSCSITAPTSSTLCSYSTANSKLGTFAYTNGDAGWQSQVALYQLTYTYTPVVSAFFGASKTFTINSVCKNSPAF